MATDRVDKWLNGTGQTALLNSPGPLSTLANGHDEVSHTGATRLK